MADDEAGPPERKRRDRELLGRKSSKFYEDHVKCFREVYEGFHSQADRADAIEDYWDAYNCVLGDNQFYNGNAELYVPIIANAVNALRTRFVNQIFPSSGRYIDATSSDGTLPRAIIALLEHYVRVSKLRTMIMMPLMRNGIVEGHFNFYRDWSVMTRHVVTKVKRGPRLASDGGVPVSDEDGDIEDIEERDLETTGPCLEVIHDNDVLVYPSTVDSLEEAFEIGGHVTIVRRWTKEKIQELVDTGEIRREPGLLLKETMTKAAESPRDVAKSLNEAAGVKDRGKFSAVYETWKKLNVPGEEGKRLVRSFYGGEDLMLSCKLNPKWSDRCPLISFPYEKIAGQFKGQSPVSRVIAMQYEANDAANEAADSGAFSMFPIVCRDPEKGNQPLVMNLGAIWDVDPRAVEFKTFPDMTKVALERIQAATQVIFQTLSVSPAMIPQSTGSPGRKRNQAEIAQEQQAEILGTAETCSIMEENGLTPLIESWVEDDHQYRDEDLTIRAYGEMGISARMEVVPPLQIGTRYHFSWFGVEQARNAQMMQQQIAWFNVAKGMGPDLMQAGYKLNPAPVLEQSAMSLFGARMGRLVLVDLRQQLAVPPELENDLMMDGHDMPVHPMDPFPEHMKAHLQAKLQTGDPTGMIQIHMQRHQMQQQMQVMAGMQQRQAQGQPNPQAGGPQPGAVPAGPRLMKGPPGMIHQDRLHQGMPRKM